MDIFNQFGVQPILLAAQVVNFLILLFILKKFLYKPVLKVIDERKKRIEDSLKNAAEIEDRLAKTNLEIEKIMAKAATDAQKMLDETKKEIGNMKEEARLQAEQQALLILKKGEEEVKELGLKMQQQVKQEVASIMTTVFQKITGKLLPQKQQKKIIEDEIKDLKI